MKVIHPIIFLVDTVQKLDGQLDSSLHPLRYVQYTLKMQLYFATLVLGLHLPSSISV